jgi:L,D-transpeptidase ErfK/SrfK
MRNLFLYLAAIWLATGPVYAEVYELPPEGYDVIGTVSTITARYEDTLVDIARRHGLGYLDIVRANPGVNPWLPGEGTEIILPSRFVLPPGPRTGLVLNLAEYRMYYFPEAGEGKPAYVYTYPMSIGRMDWETPLGKTRIIAMAKNPAWYPPQSVRDEHAADGDPLPRVVPPGPANPLGTRALRLGLPGYLIHGTNRPAGVGMRVSVRIINVPVKIGWDGDVLVAEIHPLLESPQPLAEESLAQLEKLDADIELPAPDPNSKDPLTHVTEQFIAATAERAGQLDWDHVETLVDRSNGIPEVVGTSIKNAATSAAFE